MTTNTVWYESPLRAMGSGVLEVRLEQSLRYLERRGIRVPQTGRHRNAVKLLSAVNRAQGDLDPTDTDLLVRLQYAHRDAYELFLIAFAATLRHGRANTPFSEEKLQAVMSGPPCGDGANPYPRNIQFELFVAAMLVIGSVEVRRGEPDLRILYGKEFIGVAAKRLASLAPHQAKHHFKVGIDQIRTSGLRGILAFNLDSRFTGMPHSMDSQERMGQFQATFETVEPIFEQYREPNPHVLGYLAFGYQSEWITDLAHSGKPGLMTHMPYRWFGWPNNDAEQRLYLEFSNAWRSRVETNLGAMSGRDPL